MPSIRRLAQHGASIAVASFLVVASTRTAADTPTSEEVAKRWKKRPLRNVADIRQRVRDQQGLRPEERPGAARWQALADRRGGLGLAFGPAGFHAGGLAVPELTPSNPLFDPLGIFGDETGEEDPIGPTARLFLADFDGDGDLDAFVGDKYGYVRYLENVGTASEPLYEERTGMASPTGGLDLSEDGDGGTPFGPSAPALVDIDGDDDLDLFVGQGDGSKMSGGRVLFFENDGAGNLSRNDADNPLAGNVFGVGGATPHFVDIDADGDFDAFVGTKAEGAGPGSEVYFVENQGDDETPLFVDQTDVPGVDPLAAESFLGVTAPFFVDIDGDGDQDAFVGDYYRTRFFENQSPTPEDPTMALLVEQEGYDNPLFGLPCLLPGPSFGDVDGDGDFDAFTTGGYFKLGWGMVQFHENTGDSGEPAFLAAGDRLELVDVDGDGDLDALVSYPNYSYEGDASTLSLEVRLFENTGTAAAPRWTLRSGTDNPFFTFNTTYLYDSYGYSYFPAVAPTIGDFDRDGLLDAFVGLPDGSLEYLEDDGTGQLQPAAVHPLESYDFGADADPQLVDIDGDGELDLVVGHNRYEAGGESGYYYPTVTFFLNETGPGADIDATPELVLDLTDTDIFSPAPALADIDGDGDLDLYVGGYYGSAPTLYPLTLFLENTAASPGGLAFDSTTAELVEAFVYPPNAPAVVDVNGDGVLDVALGNLCGVEFFLSQVTDLEVTKSVIGGDLIPGGTVEYLITLENTGTATIEDLDGSELVDTLPAELSLTGAMVTSGPGAVTADPGTNTVTWDGSLLAGESVVILVSADIAPGTDGQVISNQAVAFFDSNADGTNDTEEPSDDPATADVDDATSFVVDSPFNVLEIPTLSEWGALLFGALLSVAGWLGIRRMG